MDRSPLDGPLNYQDGRSYLADGEVATQQQIGTRSNSGGMRERPGGVEIRDQRSEINRDRIWPLTADNYPSPVSLRPKRHEEVGPLVANDQISLELAPALCSCPWGERGREIDPDS